MGPQVPDMHRVWRALRGARWLPQGSVQLRFIMSNQPPFRIASVGITPPGAEPQQLWLAAAAAAAVFIAVDSFESGHDQMNRIVARRLPGSTSQGTQSF